MGKRSRRRVRPSGTVVRAGGKVGPQVIDAGWARWTDAHEAAFLDELSASCNVTRAARAAGFSTNALYRRKRTDPRFAALWQASLVQGYANVEMLLLQRATEALEGRTPDPRDPLEPMTIREAIGLLKMHKASVTGEGTPRGRRPRPRSLDEVRAAILAKLEPIALLRLQRIAGQAPDGCVTTGCDDG